MSTIAPLAAAPGFDIEQLLAPISDSNPVGVDLRQTTVDGKSMLMADIEEKRRTIIKGTNENLEPREEQLDAAAVTALVNQRKRAWREVDNMLTSAFAKGKELGAAVLFVQAATISRGWVALAPSLRFVRLIQERFGDALYPVPESDEHGNLDFTDRLLILERLDHENFLPLAIGQLPLTDPRSGASFSSADYRLLQALRQSSTPKGQDPEVRRRMIQDSAKAFEDAVSKSKPAYYESLLRAMQDGAEELAALRSFVEQHYTSSSPSDRPTFLRTTEALEYCQTIARQFLSKTGGGQTLATPDSDEMAENAEIHVAERTEISALGPNQDVVQQLEEVFAYLRRHQRHNPAAFLVEEAIRWTKMPISHWYLEASEDANMSGFIAKLMRKHK